MDDTPPPAAMAIPRALVYVSDRMPGITRRRRGKGFSYLDAEGRLVCAPEERARINALAVPPAYEDVWICPLPNGHIQATGFDQRRRKQYRYHPDWSAWRSEAKFALLPEFGAALGHLRSRIARDVMRDPGDLEFTLAALTMLLDRAHLRVGSTALTRANKTYGATTLLRRHLSFEDGAIRLSFRAKGGKQVRQTLRGARLQRIFQEIDDLPGRNLFTYVTESGEMRPVASQHVNAYLAEITGIPGVTAKTFRTWAGSVAAFSIAETARDRLTIRAMTEAAAERLHNTPAICRSSYVHPTVLALAEMDAAERGRRLDALRPAGAQRLRGPERRLLGLLSQ